MKRIAVVASLLFAALSMSAEKLEYIWPKNKMPDAQEHQIAAKLPDTKKEDFRPEENRRPYLEWHKAPERHNGGCMILISGGSYNNREFDTLLILINS